MIYRFGRLLTLLLIFFHLQVSAATLCEMLNPSPFTVFSSAFTENIKSGQQFESSALSRAENKAQMNSDREKAVALIETHRNLVDKNAVLAEIGPLDTPTLENFRASDAHYVFMDYDNVAVQGLLKRYPQQKATVSQIDFNSMQAKDWNAFLKSLRDEIRSKTGKSKIQGLVMSAVVNYFDYTKVFEKLFPLFEDNAVFILTNANQGTVEMMPEFRKMESSGKTRIRPSNEIIEHLLAHHGHLLEILDGSSVTTLKDFTMNYIGTAFRIRRSESALRADQYDRILTLFLDGKIDGVGPGQSIAEAGRINDARAVSTGLSHAVKSREQMRQHELWQSVLAQKKKEYVAWRDALIGSVAKVKYGTTEWSAVKLQLEGFWQRWDLLVEREILLSALEIKEPVERGRFLRDRLEKLYQSLNHTETALPHRF